MSELQCQDMRTPEARAAYYERCWGIAAAAGNEARARVAQLEADVAELNARLIERTQTMLDRHVELRAEAARLRSDLAAAGQLITRILPLLKRGIVNRRKLNRLCRQIAGRSSFELRLVPGVVVD